MKIAVLNGPNLNLLGMREPSVYGRDTLEDIERALHALGAEIDATIEFAQHNGEGELVTAIQQLRGKADGIIINAAAYTHTSIAVRDALSGVAIPFVEVHLSNVYAREEFRHHSMLADKAVGVICGFGGQGYELALRGLVRAIASRG